MTVPVQSFRESLARAGVAAGAPLGIAVSGGSDSLALLHLALDVGYDVSAVTVDHGLRVEAAAEARVVAEHCRELGVPHRVLRWQRTVTTGNLQDQARRARYDLLRDWARDAGLVHVALGHTADDQAETILMRMARGSGLDGLSGMVERGDDGAVTWLRPLLGVERSALRRFLEDRGVSWIDDPSNEDARFDRIKARRALAALAPLGLDARKFGTMAANLSAVRRDLDLRARAAFEAAGQEESGDLVFRFPEFRQAALGPEVLRRSFVAALRWVSGADYPPRADALAELIAALRTGETRTLHGCLVSSGKTVRFTREFNAVRNVVGLTDAPWDGRWVLTGPHDPELEIRALGSSIAETPWRETGLPRASVLASPAVFRGETLIAAPVAGLANGWTAEATGRGNFGEFLFWR